MIPLFMAEIRRVWRYFLAYPANSLAGIFVMVFMFYGLFLGATYLAGPGAQFGDRLSSIVCGYMIWLLVVQVFSGIASDVREEAATGTLQQIIMSSYGTTRVFLLRAAADLTVNFTVMVLAVVGITFLTGSDLDFPPTIVFPVLSILLCATGLGFLVASLTLIFKRINSLLGILNFALLFLIMTPLETIPEFPRALLVVTPLSPSVGMLRDLMARQAPFDPNAFGIALANGLLFLVIGLTVFRLAERRAKRKGNVGSF